MDEAKMPSRENAPHVPPQDAALQGAGELVEKELPQRPVPFRIVMVNDEPFPLKAFEIFLRDWFKDAKLLLFSDPSEAWRELCQTDPDLLITDDAMPGLRGRDICQRLLDRKVSYPIIVNSPWEPTGQWVRELAERGLIVSFLPLPTPVDDLRKLVEAAFKSRGDKLEQ